MSASIVKQSLALFDKDLKDNGPPKKSSQMKGATPRDTIGTRKRAARRTQTTQAPSQKKSKTLTSGRGRSHPVPPQDHTRSNVDVLQRLAHAGRTQESCTVKVFGETACQVEKPDANASTLFTDEDFEKFAREYTPKS